MPHASPVLCSARLAAVTALLALSAACRPAPDGPPEYPGATSFTDSANPNLPGPFPYQEGDARLNVGVWYEGASSEEVPIGSGSDYFIYENTYRESTVDDRVEGFVAAEIELTGEGGFFGGGVTWLPARDMTPWTTLVISLKSDNPIFEPLEVRMIGGGNSGIVRAQSRGFVADGAWHTLVIPVSEFALQGVDLTQVTEPIQLISPQTEPQAVLLVDDVYFTDSLPVLPTETGDTGTTDTGTTDTGNPTTGFFPGPDPYEQGVERLSLGLFYEGGASETIPVDDKTAFYFIYDNTYTTATSDDRVQGFTSDRIDLAGAGTGYWGGGVTWTPARDLSAWTRMTISFQSDDPIFDQLDVRMVGGGVQGSLRATDYGFATDGSWHTLTLPLADLAAQGVDLTSVTEPIQLLSEVTADDSTLLVDNLYLDKE